MLTSPFHRSVFISDIIRILNSGAEFYREGIRVTCSEHVIAMYTRMLEEKQQAVVELLPHAKPDLAANQKQSDWLIDIERRYTSFTSQLSEQHDLSFITHLVKLESQIVDNLDAVLDTEQSQECAQTVRKIRARMIQCKEEMLSLKQAKAI
ncbi:DUF2383 domain-containing protein [Aestuariibacter sp. A3R04]|uniref:DUF2383 domain-containing protein n=1 Tax=Aestuariibacter sp. A3R04 TaxID=2841571 RepID=UPI001C08B379|nr:DUF2383 domain-containing protein [Aestuariibacter sp. A3R04]MBU3023228.1 PA2169 family four-helix-bundle protein [Aestuariibacter sp. A3R04]